MQLTVYLLSRFANCIATLAGHMNALKFPDELDSSRQDTKMQWKKNMS